MPRDYTKSELWIHRKKLKNLPEFVKKYTNLKKLHCNENLLTQCDNVPTTIEILGLIIFVRNVSGLNIVFGIFLKR